jgi:hypothetical protein
VSESRPSGHWEWDEGCPIHASEEPWDGNACPQCGAMSTYEACWRWVDEASQAERLGLPPGHTMFCDHCGADLLANGHKRGCPTQ